MSRYVVLVECDDCTGIHRHGCGGGNPWYLSGSWATPEDAQQAADNDDGLDTYHYTIEVAAQFGSMARGARSVRSPNGPTGSPCPTSSVTPGLGFADGPVPVEATRSAMTHPYPTLRLVQRMITDDQEDTE